MLNPKRRRLALLPAAAALALAAPAPVDSEVAEAADRVEVPFTMLPSNHMLVEVTLNGEGPYRMIFDLGSPVTLINNRAAKDSGIIDDDAPFAFLFSTRGEAEVEDLGVGGLKAEGVPVLVMDHPVVKALAKILDEPIDGLVGHTFFARYKTTINYQDKTMAFEPVDNEVRDFIAGLPERMMGPKVARRIILEPAVLLGLSLEDLEADGGLGVTIASVVADSPADEAGLRPGDVLTALDGRWTTSVADAFGAASHLEPGTAINAEVRRDGESLTLSLTPRPGI